MKTQIQKQINILQQMTNKITAINTQLEQSKISTEQYNNLYAQLDEISNSIFNGQWIPPQSGGEDSGNQPSTPSTQQSVVSVNQQLNSLNDSLYFLNTQTDLENEPIGDIDEQLNNLLNLTNVI